MPEENRQKFHRWYQTTDAVWKEVKLLCTYMQRRKNTINYTISEMIDDLILEKTKELFGEPNKTNNGEK
jgi:hypothetical protein